MSSYTAYDCKPPTKRELLKIRLAYGIVFLIVISLPIMVGINFILMVMEKQ